MKKPVTKYIRRRAEVESLQVRIDSNLKKQVELSAKKLHSSMNRFTEAALIFYMESLKRDGAL